MAQKDKVKELVGRGLDSYHTKALQQMDRIEKKNKEQNHKINILTNELDNDYLTKTEEGSVISLEHSKEGMVYLDELQGNTMVNYCTDGAKELTLNGDIDVEGTNVTLTEGVDNGKVDVMCEGNTLVNLSNLSYFTQTSQPTNNYSEYRLNESYIKGNMVYTLMFNASIQESNLVVQTHLKGSYLSIVVSGCNAGFNKVTFTTPSELDGVRFRVLNGVVTPFEVTDIMLLEGDWTNKETPPYFEGMKSVGELEDNKIEILSQNKNLFNGVVSPKFAYDLSFNVSSDGVISATDKNNDARPWGYEHSQYYVKLKKGDYTVTLETITPSTSIYSQIVGFSPEGNSKIQFNNSQVNTIGTYKVNFTLTEDLELGIEAKLFDGTYRMKIEKGNQPTSFIPYSLNKKEISLNEPLRGLPDGVKDRFVKQGGKWYVERNCGEVVLNGSEDWNSNYGDLTSDTRPNTKQFYINNFLNNVKNGICDNFANRNVYYEDVVGFLLAGGSASIRIGHTSKTTNEFKQWLQENPTTIVHQLITPTYEEITDVELITYLDTTHISNNSTIPCNMKIQNSGYNAIIKPSTQYTVAVDTNKSGTIGINLGGAKVTTTNNVATITTPTTLTDDSLRLYGKGIKGSKVRLLEGDKTNYIPSFFEGMKSSFEDKVQADGTFKMEILSRNENLFDIDKFINDSKSERYLNGFNCNFNGEKILHSQFKRNTRYIIRCDFDIYDDSLNVGWSPILGIQFEDGLRQEVYLNQKNYIVTTTGNRTIKYIYIRNPWRAYTYIYNISIHEDIQDFEYVKPKFNKIQFSSIEPLRGKDRFVFVNGELVIERNNAEKILNGTENWTYDTVSSSQEVGRFGFNNIGMKGNRSLVVCDKYAFKTNYTMASCNYEGTFTSVGGSTLFLDTLLNKLETKDLNGFKKWLSENPVKVVYELAEPTYEEVPFELQKIILEGYENGTLFFDTNIPPTVGVTYAGETPIVKATKLNKTEVLNNTNDINDNIVPYLMDMDYRVVCLQLEGGIENISMARLFGGTFEMLQRDILSKRYSKEEYKYRLDTYLSANKITHEEYTKLGDMLND